MRNQHQNAKIIGGMWLSRVALSFVALAAIMGWGASFVGLHAYGLEQMVGFSYWTAWLVPGTFDGAAFGATLITYRASIHGRSAVRGRLLMWTFTAVSSWINWIHQMAFEAQIVAAGLPVAAVAVFDVVLAELRADYEERHGKRRLRLRPGLLALRWLVDRTGTAGAFRQQVTDIPVSEIAGLAQPSSEHDQEPQIITALHGGATAPSNGSTAAGKDSAAHADRTAETGPETEPSSVAVPTTGAATARRSNAESGDKQLTPAEHVTPSQHERTTPHPPAPEPSTPEPSMREGASQLASPLPSGSRNGADVPPENHAEMTRPGLLLPFTPGRSDESTGSVSSNEGADQPIGPLLARSQLAGDSTSFAERWARARDEITSDEHQERRPELLVIDRRGGQPTRTARSETLQRSSNGSST